MDFFLTHQLLIFDRARQLAGATDLDTIVEHPDLNGASLETIIPVSDGVDESLPPGKSRIFKFLSEEEVSPHDSLLDPLSHEAFHLSD